MSKPAKQLPPEDSIPARVVCGALAVLAISCSFIFGKSPVPLINFSPSDMALFAVAVWMCIGGCIFSYHYREGIPPLVDKLLKTGAILISLNLGRELWLGNLHSQQFEFVYPLVNALTATSVLSCFELRTRRDIMATSAFGLTLMCLAGCSGRSIVFGACVMLYIGLGAVLLCMLARTYTASLSGLDPRLTNTKRKGRYIPALAMSVLVLPCCSLAAFSFVPRMDAQADALSTRVRSWVTAFIYQHAVNRKADDPLVEANPNQKRRQPKTEAQKQREEQQRKEEREREEREKAQREKWAKEQLEKLKAAKKEAEKEKQRQEEQQKQQQAKQQPPKQPQAKQPDPGGKGPYIPRPSLLAPPKTNGNPTPPPVAAPPSAKQPSAKQPQKPAKQNTTVTKVAKRGNGPGTQRPGAQGGKQPGAQGGKQPQPQQKQQAPKPSGLPDESELAPKPKEKEPGPNETKPKTAKEANPDLTSNVSLDEAMSHDTSPAFTIACNRQVYTTLLTCDKFDGRTWLRSDATKIWTAEPTVRGVNLQGCMSLEVSSALPVTELIETFNIKHDLGTNVPVAGVPKSLSLLQGVAVDKLGNVTTVSPIEQGTKYSAVCQWPIYSIDQLRSAHSFADTSDTYVAPYLDLPEDQSDEAIRLSAELCKDGNNRFVQAQNIVAYLRKNYKYAPNPVTAEDAHANLADQFLFNSKTGDCKAFATAFIVLCRAGGIPARFVAGFSPGDTDPISGATIVRFKHGHAWAEIYMEPFGWISFDPSPGGLLPARPEQHYYNYAELRRQATSNASSASASLITNMEMVLRYAGFIIAGAALVLSLVAMILSATVLRKLAAQLRERLRYKHPAVRAREKLMKQLGRFGVVKEPSDTADDVLRKLEAALQQDLPHRPPDEKQLLTSVDEFFKTYNAVRFGNDKAMDRLQAIAVSLDYQLKPPRS